MVSKSQEVQCLCQGCALRLNTLNYANYASMPPKEWTIILELLWVYKGLQKSSYKIQK